MKAEWAAGEYYKSGLTLADLLTVAIGPITPIYPDPPTPTIYSNQYGFDAMAIPDFVAGMIFGFTGDNELPEIEACFHGTQDLVTDAENLLKDLEAGNWIHAIDDYAAFSTQLADSVHGCSGQALDDDFAAIEAWAEIFTEPTHLAETVAKNWLLHKRGIKKDIANEEADWASGNYFAAGCDTADALVKLVGPVQV